MILFSKVAILMLTFVTVTASASVHELPGRRVDLADRVYAGTFGYLDRSDGTTEKEVVATVRREADRISFMQVQSGKLRGFIVPLENSLVEKLDVDGFTRRETNVQIDSEEIIAVIEKSNDLVKRIEKIRLAISGRTLSVSRSIQMLEFNPSTHEWLPQVGQAYAGLYSEMFQHDFTRSSDRPMSVETLEMIAAHQAGLSYTPRGSASANERIIAHAVSKKPLKSAEVVSLSAHRASKARCEVLFETSDD